MAVNFRSSHGIGFIYNKDLTGDVMIRLPKPDSDSHDILRVPASAITEFMAEVVKQYKIEKMEKMKAIDILVN